MKYNLNINHCIPVFKVAIILVTIFIPSNLYSQKKQIRSTHSRVQTSGVKKSTVNIKKIALPNDSDLICRAMNGDADAQAFIGRCYFLGSLGVPENNEEAYKWIQKSVKNGSVCGLYYSGLFYKYGYKVKENAEKCNEILFKAFNMLSNKTDITSREEQFLLGYCYFYGIGTNKNLNLALKWLEKSANQNFQEAQYELGNLYKETNNYTKALLWYQKSASNKDENAQFEIGLCYLNGLGVEKNLKEAFTWIALAAQNGQAEAEYWLGRCYEDGTGCNKDLDKAIKCYKKASLRHIYGALYKLGCFYRDGIGLDRSYTLAVKYLQEAYDESDSDYDISGSDLEEMISKGRTYYQKLPKRSKIDLYELTEDDPFTKIALSDNWNELDDNTKKMYQKQFKREKLNEWGEERAKMVADHLVEIGFTTEQLRFSQGSNYTVEVVEIPSGRIIVWIYEHCSYFFINDKLVAMLWKNGVQVGDLKAINSCSNKIVITNNNR